MIEAAVSESVLPYTKNNRTQYRRGIAREIEKVAETDKWTLVVKRLEIYDSLHREYERQRIKRMRYPGKIASFT